jgi:hypothetical protein
MKTFHSFVNQKSHQLLQCWINELEVDIKISKPRKTKLGDFKVRGRYMSISINNNLNKYSFLITLTHELAHAFVFKKYQKMEKPHAKFWKLTFKSLMLNFLSNDYFPADILMLLSRHMINPKASTFTDLELSKVLRKYDQVKLFTLSDLAVGESFKSVNGKIYIKGERIRKRYKCIEYKTNRIYLFHPLSEVIKQQ